MSSHQETLAAINSALPKCGDYQAVMLHATNLAEEIKQKVGAAVGETALYEAAKAPIEAMQVSAAAAAAAGQEMREALISIQRGLQRMG
ncbi:hypothetical protein G3I59_36870 [Amycolatopsis rubida]|uniref:Uncharacterized protein n=1 Tax=Amycolatopsis rubida TaxID=112413 RepID=A0ABX0BZL2_9PSEU|nr:MULTISPECIES: hypothetical protein [Amycolatopsis]MYW96033.1 hypothetical protein [Amycolatopsis rubida]NEC61024.1 hypothetical protein [Amycolatopsis rubida]OAP20536.1 hypothetical protein A4R44_08696 [Amycolatopsis sp. M39]